MLSRPVWPAVGGAETRKVQPTWVSALQFAVAAVLFVAGVRTLAEIAQVGAIADQLGLRQWLRYLAGR